MTLRRQPDTYVVLLTTRYHVLPQKGGIFLIEMGEGPINFAKRYEKNDSLKLLSN